MPGTRRWMPIGRRVAAGASASSIVLGGRGRPVSCCGRGAAGGGPRRAGGAAVTTDMGGAARARDVATPRGGDRRDSVDAGDGGEDAGTSSTTS